MYVSDDEQMKKRCPMPLSWQTLMQCLLQKAVQVSVLPEEVLDHSSIKASLV